MLRVRLELSPHGYTQLTDAPPPAWAAWLHEHETTIDELVQGVEWLFETEDERTAWAGECSVAIQQMIHDAGPSVLAPVSPDTPNPGPEYI